MESTFKCTYQENSKTIEATAIAIRKEDVPGKKHKKTYYTVRLKSGEEKEIEAAQIIEIIS